MLYPVLHRVSTFLVRDEDDTAVIKAFKQDLRMQIERRFVSNFCEFAAIASALDPRFKSMECLPELTRDTVFETVEDLCSKVILTSNENEDGGATTEPSVEEDFFGEIVVVPTNKTGAEEYKL